MAKKNTWELKGNLGNIENLVREFKKEYREEIEWSRKRIAKEKKKREELPGRYIAKLLYE